MHSSPLGFGGRSGTRYRILGLLFLVAIAIGASAVVSVWGRSNQAQASRSEGTAQPNVERELDSNRSPATRPPLDPSARIDFGAPAREESKEVSSETSEALRVR